MSFDSIVSKIAAGGLSAGVFLFWWPEHVPGDDLMHLVARGLLWTLTFEMLLIAFAPLERQVRARLHRRTEVRRTIVLDRLSAAPAPARTGGAVALAALGLAGPLVLLADAPRQLVRDADARPRIVRQVIVQRPIIRREVVVRRVVGPAAADAAAGRTQSATATAVPAPAAPTRSRPAAAKPARTTTATRNAGARRVVGTVERTETPAAQTTPAAPVDSTATPAPAAADTAAAPPP